jgi:hypothetical protein
MTNARSRIPLNFSSISKKPTFSDSGEPIYALMLSGKATARVRYGINAIHNFLIQDYGNRYLVIINQGERSYDIPQEYRARISQYNVNGDLSLGDMRNFAMGRVRGGGIVLQWDDDDWRHSSLMSLQYKHMVAEKLDGVALRNQIKYDSIGNNSWGHTLPSDYFGFAGTIMVKVDHSIVYPSISGHEDSSFWKDYISKHRCAQCEVPAHYYIRLVHLDNITSNLRIFKKATNEWRIPTEMREYVEAAISKHLRAGEGALVINHIESELYQYV